MIKKEDIYASTNSGLTILQYYYPNIQEEYAYNRHKFKLRNEDDASAVLRKRELCFCITDFGGDAKEKTPIDIAMEFENLNFYETCCLLAERYGVSEHKTEYIKPGRSERPANEDEPDGSFSFNEKQVTAKELNLMGPGVTQEIFKRMGWISLADYTVVKERKAVTKSSTDNFPIFARACKYEDAKGALQTFYKLYQPLNDKQYRFIYYPIGCRPPGYINGLYELEKAFKRANEKDDNEEDSGETKDHTPKKLDYAYICSGERDALTLAARGGNPIWFNSETAQITAQDISTIRRYVKFLYNIPDIDDTGLRQGKLLALTHLEISTIWLPQELTKFRDWRGKPRKDFRDWAELHPSQYEFEQLRSQAMTAAFWQLKKNKFGAVSVELNSELFQYFMELNNFFLYKEEGRSDVYTLMHRQGHKIVRTSVRDIKEWLKNWARAKFLNLEVRNMIAGTKITEGEIKSINIGTVNNEYYGYDWQLYFFDNCVWKITADGINDVTKAGYSTFEDDIIKHKVHILEKPFDCYQDEDGNWKVDVKNTNSKYFGYLINSSRIYWRRELEQEYNLLGENAQFDYLCNHKFCINSPLLNEVENNEQQLNLASKIFAIGYYLHRYKDPAKAWAAYGMDWKLGQNGQNNGRSGKSFFYMFAKYMLTRLTLSGRNKKLLDNNHVFENITRYTDIVIIDDCDRSIKPSDFYTSITGDITINPKQTKSFELNYEDSPKFAFTTNYVPDSYDGSDIGRLIYLVFGDYYHEKTDEYQEKRQISDDFGKSLFTNYNEEEWNEDFNFWCWCLQFYLANKENGKINPCLDNIMKRSLKAKLDASFEDWAEGYFSIDGQNCNRLIPKVEVMSSCRYETGKQMTSQAFMKKLDAWVQLSTNHETFNPRELWSKNSNRIIKTISGNTMEYIYVKTYKVGLPTSENPI